MWRKKINFLFSFLTEINKNQSTSNENVTELRVWLTFNLKFIGTCNDIQTQTKQQERSLQNK